MKKGIINSIKELTGAAEDILYRDIMNSVEVYWSLREIKAPFRPGIDPVPVSGKVIDTNDMKHLVGAMLEGWLTEGHWVEKFEHAMAHSMMQKAAAMTNSGSSANLLAISALTSNKMGSHQLMPGDKVVTAAAGFPTTINPIFQNRLVPVFIDVELETYVPALDAILRAIEDSGTKAVILAHTLGNPWLVDRIMDENPDVWIIEDNCDSLWSELNGKRTGSFGDLATQSFYPAHHITTGEGGMVLGNAKLIKIVKGFRDWGRDCWCPTGQDNTCGKRFEWELGSLPKGYDHKYIYSELGYNLKSTDLQGALGLSQISKIRKFTDIRKMNFAMLRSLLGDLEEFFYLPKATEGSDPSWFGFPLTIRDGAPFNLGQVEKQMAAQKIGTRRLFAGNYIRQPLRMGKMIPNPTAGGYYSLINDLRNTDKVMTSSFWIGVWHGLEPRQIEYMAESIHNFVNQF